MGRGTTIRAALAVATLLGLAAPTAGAQEPVAGDPAAAEATHGQLVTALKAQPMVGADTVMGDDEDPSLITTGGTYDVARGRFSGTMSMLFLGDFRVYATKSRTLVRPKGSAGCWLAQKTSKSPTPEPGAKVPFTVPTDLIDKTTLGPAVYSVLGPDEIQWSLGGKTPAEVTERFDPATMLPLVQTVTQHEPATKKEPAYIFRVTTNFSYVGLKLIVPRKPRICKKGKGFN